MKQQRLDELRQIARGLHREGLGYWGIYYNAYAQAAIRRAYEYGASVQEVKQVIEEVNHE